METDNLIDDVSDIVTIRINKIKRKIFINIIVNLTILILGISSLCLCIVKFIANNNVIDENCEQICFNGRCVSKCENEVGYSAVDKHDSFIFGISMFSCICMIEIYQLYKGVYYYVKI